jgi:hypothetical protein
VDVPRPQALAASTGFMLRVASADWRDENKTTRLACGGESQPLVLDGFPIRWHLPLRPRFLEPFYYCTVLYDSTLPR